MTPTPVNPAHSPILAMILAAVPATFDAVTRTWLAQLAQDAVVDLAGEALEHWTVYGPEVLALGPNASLEARSLATELPVLWMGLARLHPSPAVAEYLRPIERLCLKHAPAFIIIHEAHPQLPTQAKLWMDDAEIMARLETPAEPAEGWTDAEYDDVERQTNEAVRQRAGDLLDGLDDMDLLLAAFGAWASLLDGQDAERANALCLNAINHILPCTEWVQSYPYAFGTVTSLCVAVADATRVDVGEEHPELEASLLKYAGIMDAGVTVLSREEANDLAEDAFLGPIPDMIAEIARVVKPGTVRMTCIKPSGPPVDMLPTVTPGIHPPHQAFYIRKIVVGDGAMNLPVGNSPPAPAYEWEVSDAVRDDMRSWIDRHNATPKQPAPAVTYIKP